MGKYKFLILFFIIIVIIVFLYYENNYIVTTKVELKLRGVPSSFEGLKILQISDLHNKSFGKGQSKLIKIVEDAKPDLIAITGDIIDRRKYNEEPAVLLARGISQIAPTFYVNGNHEAWSGKVSYIEDRLVKSGVKVLRNESYKVTRDKDYINIIGIDDPTSSYLENYRGEQLVGEEIDNVMKKISQEDFNVLLSHRPEMIDVYASRNMQLVLSGHAHGGQVRLPFIGGLASPGQGLFPRYSEGIIYKNKTAMVISRGLGNSIIPQRLFNRPEVVLITLMGSSQ